jgi:hypothetical protein
LTADELLIVLNTFDIPAEPIWKIIIIKDFINGYLYNVEPIIAEALLNYDVKAKFKLTAADLKPLMQMCS